MLDQLAIECKKIRIAATLGSTFQGHIQGQMDEKLDKIQN